MSAGRSRDNRETQVRLIVTWLNQPCPFVDARYLTKVGQAVALFPPDREQVLYSDDCPHDFYGPLS